MEKPSPSRSESFSRGGWLIRSKARVAPSFESLDVDACLGEAFNVPTASFIDDMDPAELFSMRWTTSGSDTGFDFGLPLLTTAAAGDVLPFPREPSRVARDGGAYADVSSSASSPAFRTAQSTPEASVVPARSGSRRSSGASKDNRTAPLLATRRLLLRYLRFLAPLCRKARSSLAPRSGSGSGRVPSATAPARRSASSTNSVSSAVPAEHWCHGNADTAVRDAILYCKKSFTDRAEC